MSAPETCHFQPGQLVECIDDDWVLEGVRVMGAVPARGCIYTVSGVEEEDGVFYVWLLEFDPSASFSSLNFRPVQTPDIGIFRGLLAPTPAAIREVEPA